MADENKEAKPKGGAPIGIILGGGVGVLLMSIPIYLMAQGILAVEGPRFRPSDKLIMSDSLLAAYYATQDAFGLLDVDETQDPSAAQAAGQGQIQAAGGQGAPQGQIQAATQPAQTQAATQPAARAAETQPPAQATTQPAAQPAQTAAPDAASASKSTPAASDSDALTVAVFNKSGKEVAVDDAKLARLVKVYEKMRPKQVAVILGTMSVEQSAAILVLMKDKSAAEVLAAMNAQRAARISQIMVQKKAG